MASTSLPQVNHQIRASRFRQRQIPHFYQDYRRQIDAINKQAAGDAARQQSQNNALSQNIQAQEASRRAGVSSEVASSLQNIQGIAPSGAPDYLAQQASAARATQSAGFGSNLASQGLAQRNYLRNAKVASYSGQIQAQQFQAGQTGALRAQRQALRQQARADAAKLQMQQQLAQDRLNMEQSRLNLAQQTAKFNQTLAVKKFATSQHQGAVRLKQGQERINAAAKKAKAGGGAKSPKQYEIAAQNLFNRALNSARRIKSDAAGTTGQLIAPTTQRDAITKKVTVTDSPFTKYPVIAEAAAQFAKRQYINPGLLRRLRKQYPNIHWNYPTRKPAGKVFRP